MNPFQWGKKICSNDVGIKRQLLISLQEAKLLLGTTGKTLSDEKISHLSEFTEHLGTYLVEQYINGKLA
ncbi:MAG TPA: hypothetical protein PK048_01820 [Candidatus Absconditabacterales bacterium]|nr:hypothetical protein [Candidatus Absconditabacterales bacterium]